jgi:hypothetical protein
MSKQGTLELNYEVCTKQGMRLTVPANVEATFQKAWFTWSPFFADMRNDAKPFSSANLLCCTARTAVRCFRSSECHFQQQKQC